MSDSLLSYFEQELRFIRNETSQFAERHPGTARALGMRKDSIDDPQIARLIESVALMNGKLQQRLDESYPELTESLVNLLFPHYLRPIPSYSMLDFAIFEEANAKHSIPKGTEFDVASESGEPVVFRTSENIALLPIQVASAEVLFAPFELAKPVGAENAKAMLELTIEATDSGIELRDLDIDQLKLHLKGESHFALRLYDVLADGRCQVCIQNNGKSYSLGKSALQPIGFDVNDTILPYQAASFGGFKLLTEFFMFPERFQGFKLDLGNIMQHAIGSEFRIQIFLNEMSVVQARSIQAQHFSLFCTPLVNLQTKVSEPLQIDFTQKQYPIYLDASQGNDLEVFSVDEVLDVTEGEPFKVCQIYGDKYNSTETALRWQLVQDTHERGVLRSGLKVADIGHVSATTSSRVWSVTTTATDGIRAGSLPVNSQVTCRESLTIPATMNLLRRPTLPVRSRDANKNVWALLCHLHFNYHAILGTDDPTATLKNVFDLYNHNQAVQNHIYIESLQNIEQEQVVAPIRVSGKTCFAYGTKISVTLDASNVNGGVSLFGHLLDHFFAYFAGFNSFTQVDIYLEGQDGVYLSFPRRTGCKSLL
ncbi:type VI secretion system baseplate subunit TssF [Vibrio anguillarum]|uniref:Type VI secretion system baseplate subunit TssF n=3 Tax=Vibrio anguillarum TaxID=55601 RepID=A0A241PQY1_VIBAN|nr:MULTISPECIES: type VI secretion system baseplate subunit TssF [Vibrio]ASG07540.1 type VI secretion system ImpG/VasA family protein [Vibrio anguillarum]ASW81185.1 type VI secretion system baseplate subunit TssF [Vibrio anguillarum]AZS23757.1 type VI secretion system baseplate subunit TssF [Vibrio anguillarum]MBF4256965.1 type VI secretion system baseplate subunit TssF [Vibrio anguillarum]MBF4278349.1 type VI secretion system baseplate subunit TssF [Vibrio anguillarum]